MLKASRLELPLGTRFFFPFLGEDILVLRDKDLDRQAGLDDQIHVHVYDIIVFFTKSMTWAICPAWMSGVENASDAII